MMDYNDIRDIALAREERELHYQDAHTVYPASITSQNGLTYRPSLGQDYAWIYLFGQVTGLATAYDKQRMNLMGVGTPVWVMRAPESSRLSAWQIVDVNDNYTVPGQETPTSNFVIGDHAANHQRITETNVGSDPLSVFQPMLMPLRTVAPGNSHFVFVYGYEYEYLGVHQTFLGQTVYLGYKVPSLPGFTLKVLLYLDLATNTIVEVDGSTVAIGSPIPDPVVPIDTDAVASARVVLEGEMISIEQTDILDARDYLGGGGTTIADPTEPGQVYMSDDDGNRAWLTPVTSPEDGWLVNDDGELLTEG